MAIVGAEAASRLADGSKRIESRFTRSKRLPYNRVSVGDHIHFKLTGGSIIGTYAATRVVQLERLTPARIRRLRARYNGGIRASASYWYSRRRARFAVLIWITPLPTPPAAPPVPRQYGSAWFRIGGGGE
ncbi:MAG: hypothetical protein KKB50_18340 [Planctomycetes bacterium]|nr:hypothetical protein [Planctomycetota bacterium]